MVATLQKYYENIIRQDFIRKTNSENVHCVPKIEKIILSMGVKEAALDKKQLLLPLLLLELISGQKAVPTYAKNAVSNFKIRKGALIGTKVILRRDRMYEFLTKLIVIVLPRLRDFRGFATKSINICNQKNGTLSFGLTDVLIFPEVELEYDKVDKKYGLNVTIVTNACTAIDTQLLLSSFQIPFKK